MCLLPLEWSSGGGLQQTIFPAHTKNAWTNWMSRTRLEVYSDPCLQCLSNYALGGLAQSEIVSWYVAHGQACSQTLI